MIDSKYAFAGSGTAKEEEVEVAEDETAEDEEAVDEDGNEKEGLWWR